MFPFRSVPFSNRCLRLHRPSTWPSCAQVTTPAVTWWPWWSPSSSTGTVFLLVSGNLRSTRFPLSNIFEPMVQRGAGGLVLSRRHEARQSNLLLTPPTPPHPPERRKIGQDVQLLQMRVKTSGAGGEGAGGVYTPTRHDRAVTPV